MKRQFILTVFAVLGVFLLLRTPLLAQSTGTREKEEAVREAERAEREAERDVERATRSTRIIVPPEVPKIYGTGFDHDFDFVMTYGSSSERNTKLTLSKDYDGESTSKTGTFSVDQGVRKIRLSVSGSVKSGKINLELYLPGKKELKKLTIDESADIQWSQSIDVKEGETMYSGEWTYVINAQSAKGYYSLSLSTY